MTDVRSSASPSAAKAKRKTRATKRRGSPRHLRAKGTKGQALRETSEGLRLLHGGTAEEAEAHGFSAIGIAPFGPAHRAVRQLASEEGLAEIDAAARSSSCIIDLPFVHHAPNSALRKEHPRWFAAPADENDVVDPRKPAQRAHLKLLLNNPATHEEQIAWLVGIARKIADAGASGLRMPGLKDVPSGFARDLVSAIRSSRDRLILIGDVLGGSFDHVKAMDDAGFDYLFDSAAWWDGVAGWYPEQREALRTPAMAFPEAPEGDDLSARVRNGGLATAAIWHTVLAAVSAKSFLVPKALLDRGGPEFASFVRDLNAARSTAAWLDRAGPLRIAGTGKAILRFDAEPRHAKSALGFVPSGTEPAAYRALGTLSATEHPATTGGALIRASREDPGAAIREGSKADEARLRELAETRIAIEGVYPEIDAGRFPAKRIIGDILEVGADIFCDGHEQLAARFILTEAGAAPRAIPMRKQANDRWTGSAVLTRIGNASITIEAWRDLFASWHAEILKKRAAGQNVALELIEGRAIAERSLAAMDRRGMPEADARLADALAAEISRAGDDQEALSSALENDAAVQLFSRYGERTNLSIYQRSLSLVVDREQARFSAWYELFPRSQSGKKDVHGTFDDVIARIPYVRDLGFDVLYFPPIHPIGRTNMKGKNNTLTPDTDDVGSPYAIGSEAGGHDAVHPQLGSIDDFDRMVAVAADHGLEIALDFAIQCSPDHPWLKQHPEWFDWRPDGTIRFAENPPKKYEDIVNVHFYRDALPSLWYALRDVLLYWCEHRVRIFRVDNPHTKPYPFWEWVIGEVKSAYPDTLFLSEAFTRPKIMKRLAKLGFTQSYTYYTWRNTKHELESYVRELTETDTREVMNPNFFVNTPDINPGVLQSNNRAAYIARTILAGTLASSYGIYNGVEIAEGTPLPGKEEYLDSEKYEIRVWDFDRPGHIKDDIRRLNRWRAQHPALQDHTSIRLLTVWNEQVLWYAKRTPDRRDYLLFGVTLDFEREQRASVEIPLWEFGLPDDATIDAEDLVTEDRFSFTGKHQEITLSPARPYVAFRLLPPAGFQPAERPLFSDPEVSE